MLRSKLVFRTMIRLGRWCGVAAAVACLGLSGCRNFDLRGDDFYEDATFSQMQRYRPPDRQTLPHAVTNRGIEIARNLGVGRP